MWRSSLRRWPCFKSVDSVILLPSCANLSHEVAAPANDVPPKRQVPSKKFATRAHI